MPLDGRNWKPETETKPGFLTQHPVATIERLIPWLESKPPETEYDPRNSRDCVIIRWAHETGQPNGIIDPDCAAVCFTDVDGIQTYGAALSRARALLASRSKG